MNELTDFAVVVLVASAGLLLAILSSTISERLRVPAPVVFLVAAALASDVRPGLASPLDPEVVGRIGTVALIVILFAGGLEIGWRQFRDSIVPIASLGLPGTFATAAVVAGAMHWLVGMEWGTSWIAGAALAPTDPAVMFSVLGKREIAGRTGTILRGESGANDPVSIALTVGVLEFVTGDGSVAGVGTTFLGEMILGLAVGVAGGRLLLALARRLPLPSAGFYPVRMLVAAGVIYGAAGIVHGSGFLAVFVAGILLGDERFPFKHETESFLIPAAGLAEVAVFVVLGLTVDLGSFGSAVWSDGLVAAAVLLLVARPAVTWLFLLPVRLSAGEKLFVIWAGMKGAVPVLLGTFALAAGADQAQRVYGIIFVVVAVTVLIQGTTMNAVSRVLSIPMKPVEPAPWRLSIGLHTEPSSLRRYVVAPGAPATTRPIGKVPLDGASIGLIIREGRAEQARGDTMLRAGDEVLVVAEEERQAALDELFGSEPEVAP